MQLYKNVMKVLRTKKTLTCNISWTVKQSVEISQELVEQFNDTT